MKVGDWVYTPRFCKVKIVRIFDSVEEAYAEGFTEPTHYDEIPLIKVLGRSLGTNCMDFCAARANN